MFNLAFYGDPRVTPAHIGHCLSYIRQGVLCEPDLTLEPGDFEKREYNPGDTGATHVCRDWNMLYRYVEENFWEKGNVTAA